MARMQLNGKGGYEVCYLLTQDQLYSKSVQRSRTGRHFYGTENVICAAYEQLLRVFFHVSCFSCFQQLVIIKKHCSVLTEKFHNICFIKKLICFFGAQNTLDIHNLVKFIRQNFCSQSLNFVPASQKLHNLPDKVDAQRKTPSWFCRSSIPIQYGAELFTIELAVEKRNAYNSTDGLGSANFPPYLVVPNFEVQAVCALL